MGQNESSVPTISYHQVPWYPWYTCDTWEETALLKASLLVLWLWIPPWTKTQPGRITKENRWIFTFEGLDSVKNPCHPCLQIQCVYSPGNAVVLHFHLECGELAYDSYCSTGVLRGVGSVVCPLEASSHFFASVTTSPNSSANHSCKNHSKGRRRIETPSSTCNTNMSKN